MQKKEVDVFGDGFVNSKSPFGTVRLDLCMQAWVDSSDWSCRFIGSTCKGEALDTFPNKWLAMVDTTPTRRNPLARASVTSRGCELTGGSGVSNC